MATQFDILRQQAEAAARNAAARVQGNLRRDTSLVNQASRWAGRTLTQGEAQARKAAGKRRRGYTPSGETQPQPPRPTPPAPDGYIRRSPVQPLHVAADYRKQQLIQVATAVVVLAVIGLGVYLLNQLGVFTR